MATQINHFSPAEFSRNKEKAIDDATQAQASITEECAAVGRDAPPYILTELIGKGSFGRVYKARRADAKSFVAVKIISIEEGDSICPGSIDTFNDILKEVNTLKILGNKGSKNVNCVLDTHLVGQSVWIITEYCAGGSVATLMRPTGGLIERWIIPILREAAEAIQWVHSQGVIHRDIKCANVLITETGSVQLCDFGVAGIIETRFDKRTTVTGTLQWMAPELFDPSTSYGVEVDIWAFGSMAYEVATGLPPNAAAVIDTATFGSYLQRNCPRLEGDQYSSQLKDIVACCMVPDPAQRPNIEQVQEHPYICNTSSEFPTATLSQLVNAYRLWEMQGGSRKSLFSAGGAQGSISTALHEDNQWNFDTMSGTDLQIDVSEAQMIHATYEPQVDTSLSRKAPGRRRPPIMKPLTVPLEQVFDPNFDANYEDNTRMFYGGMSLLSPSNDLPLRVCSGKSTVRESLIDSDTSLDGNDLSQFVDLTTIRAGSQSTQSRLTQEWKFPKMVPNSAPPDQYEMDIGTTPSDASSTRILSAVQPHRISNVSLINLDASLFEQVDSFSCPRTTDYDTLSLDSDAQHALFGLEEHVSVISETPIREPSIYVSDVYKHEGLQGPGGSSLDDQPADSTGHDSAQSDLINRPQIPRAFGLVIPQPPSADVMLGTSTKEELKNELRRLVLGLGEHLQVTSDILADLMGH